MLETTLQQIGLPEKQARIYMACLELGECSIKEIAKKAEVKRTTIYDIIDDMIATGFIRTTMQGKKKRFLAAEPSELESIIKKREALLAQILPQLNSLNNGGGAKPKVWFYEGKDGLKDVYADTLKYGGELLSFASEHVANILGKDWMESYF
jgi:HTH-type transcriptional regulator, sugar sensing transcriptional regulator